MIPLISWTALAWIIIIGVNGAEDQKIYSRISCLSWTRWRDEGVSECDVSCGTGVQVKTRKRTCRQPGFFDPRAPAGCRYAQVEETKLACDTGIPCTGTPTHWGRWSPSGPCDYCRTRRRTFIRERSCSDEGLCEGGLTQTKQSSCVRSFQHLQLCYYCQGFRTFIFTYKLPVFNMCVYGTYQEVTFPDRRGSLYKSCGSDRNSPKCRVYSTVELLCNSYNG